MQPLKQSLPAWQESMADCLQTKLQFALCDKQLNWTALSELECDQVKQFVVEKRRRHWLRGRNALKQVLVKLGLPPDTSHIAFPHPQLSLSHSEGYALAVGTINHVRGLGIDLEFTKGPRIDAAHLFLSKQEYAAWQQMGEDQTMLRRIWCIKEAAFKSNPNNATTGLFEYVIENIDALSGRLICLSNKELAINYVCDEIEIGRQLACVSIAVAR